MSWISLTKSDGRWTKCPQTTTAKRSTCAHCKLPKASSNNSWFSCTSYHSFE